MYNEKLEYTNICYVICEWIPINTLVSYDRYLSAI